jgi:hypothetical protein
MSLCTSDRTHENPEKDRLSDEAALNRTLFLRTWGILDPFSLVPENALSGHARADSVVCLY